MPTTSASLLPRLLAGRFTLYELIRRDRLFLVFVGCCFFIAGAAYPHPQIAMWVGFLLAGYSTIANDSIQTIGTFIASTRTRRWWVLWLFIGSVFVLTVLYSWLVNDGDVSYQRLAAKGFADAPASFTFLQVAAPIFLLILTRLRMPVSTTFLILSSFSASTDAITAMLVKSVAGYGVAFAMGLGAWLLLTRWMDRRFRGTASAFWYPLQWISTGFLWMTWIMQDAANIAVYLPRQLSGLEFTAFASFIFFGLGILFFVRGDRIQRVVDEKSDVLDVRPATVIDFVYGILLFVFKEISVIPMSTTWVFIGLLAGREIGLRSVRRGKAGLDAGVFTLMGRDLAYAGIGLLVSILIAVATNPSLWPGR